MPENPEQKKPEQEDLEPQIQPELPPPDITAENPKAAVEEPKQAEGVPDVPKRPEVKTPESPKIETGPVAVEKPAHIKTETQPTDEKDARRIKERALIEAFGGFAEKINFQEGSDKIMLTDEPSARVFYGMAAGLFMDLGLGDLNAKVREKAKEAAEKERPGCRIMSKADYFGREHAAEARKKIQKQAWAEGIKTAWDSLPPQEKTAAGNINKFGFQLEEDRRALKLEGFEFTPDEYYQLLKEGYDPRTIKEKGFWGKKIEMERLKGAKGEKYSVKKENFSAQMQERQKALNAGIDKKTAEMLAVKYKEGRNKWLRRKIKAAGEIIIDSTPNYQQENPIISAAVVKEVEPETITLEQQEQKVKLDCAAKLAELDDVAADFTKAFKLDSKQKAGLNKFIFSGQGTLDFVPKELTEVVKAMADKKAAVDKERDNKLKAIAGRRIAALKIAISQKISAIAA